METGTETGTIYREISTEIGTDSSQPNLSSISNWEREQESFTLPGTPWLTCLRYGAPTHWSRTLTHAHLCACERFYPAAVRLHVHVRRARFARLCESYPLCRSIPRVEGEARFGGKNARVWTRSVRVRICVCFVYVCAYESAHCVFYRVYVGNVRIAREKL